MAWDDIKAKMREILIQVARIESTISYSELASQLNLHHRNPKFMRLLLEISESDEQNQGPSLAVLVVAKATGRPGEGFFVGIDANLRESYWQKRFTETCDYWQTHDEDH